VFSNSVRCIRNHRLFREVDDKFLGSILGSILVRVTYTHRSSFAPSSFLCGAVRLGGKSTSAWQGICVGPGSEKSKTVNVNCQCSEAFRSKMQCAFAGCKIVCKNAGNFARHMRFAHSSTTEQRDIGSVHHNHEEGHVSDVAEDEDEEEEEEGDQWSDVPGSYLGASDSEGSSDSEGGGGPPDIEMQDSDAEEDGADDDVTFGASNRLRQLWRDADADSRLRLRTCLAFADAHHKAIDVQAMFELAGLSERDATTFSAKLAPDLPCTKTRKRWLRKLMQLFYGEDIVSKVTFRYKDPSLGAETQTVNGFHRDLKSSIVALLEDTRFTDMNTMFTADHARNLELMPNLLPDGEDFLGGEPMLGSFCVDMNAKIVAEHAEEAAAQGCDLVLPVPYLSSFDAMSPDVGLNKSFNLMYITLLNRPLSIRRKPSSWLLYSLFTCFRVGKDATTQAGRSMYRRIALQDQLKDVVATPFVELYRNPFVMNTIGGAQGRRIFVVPYPWGFSCDLLAANEISNTEGQSNPADWSARSEQGVFFSSAPGTNRPRARVQMEMIAIVADNRKYKLLKASRALTKVEAFRKKRAESRLKLARLKPETPGLSGLAKIWGQGYTAGIYGRIKFTDSLHLFDLGLLRACFLWLWLLLASFGSVFLTAHSSRVGAQPGTGLYLSIDLHRGIKYATVFDRFLQWHSVPDNVSFQWLHTLENHWRSGQPNFVTRNFVSC
jgi:hypothetical protein